MNSSSEYSTYNSSPSTVSSSSFGNTDESGLFSNKNGIIIFLLILLILSFLGINMLAISGNILEEFSKLFGPMVKSVASILGYSAGELVDTTADVTADAAKLGIDISEGSIHSVGKLLKSASKGGINDQQRKNLDLAISSPKQNTNTPEKSPEPSQTADSIHRSISSKKGGWCFIGEDAGSRGCISVDEHDKCMSGQIFPSKESCVRTPDS